MIREADTNGDGEIGKFEPCQLDTESFPEVATISNMTNNLMMGIT